MRDRSPASQFVRCGYDPISRGDLVDAVSLISRTRWATQCPHAFVGPHLISRRRRVTLPMIADRLKSTGNTPRPCNAGISLKHTRRPRPSQNPVSHNSSGTFVVKVGRSKNWISA